jgi:cytochrome c5
MNKKVSLAFVALGLMASVAVFSASDLTEAMKKRIQPAGELCMEGSDCAAAPVAAPTGEPRTGQQVYETKCFTCHASGAAGAPKFGAAGDWTPRIANGIDALYANAINGVGGMPAKGLCMDCSDDEISAAVDHIIAGSQ